KSAAATVAGAVLLLVLPVTSLLVCARRPTQEMLADAARFLVSKNTGWIAVLAFGPIMLTLIAGMLCLTKASTNYMIPIFAMVPVALMLALRCDIGRQGLHALATITLAILTATLLAAPIAAQINKKGMRYGDANEVAKEATRLWHDAVDRPLRIVAGSTP